MNEWMDYRYMRIESLMKNIKWDNEKAKSTDDGDNYNDNKITWTWENSLL